MKTARSTIPDQTTVIFNEKSHLGGMQQLADSVKISLEKIRVPVIVFSHQNILSSLYFIYTKRKKSFFWAFYGNLSPFLIFFSWMLGNKNYFLSYGPIVDPLEWKSRNPIKNLKKRYNEFLLILNHFIFLFFSNKILHISQYEKQTLLNTWPYSLLRSKKSTIIYPAIAEKKSQKKYTPAQAKEFFGLKKNIKLLVTVGRLERRKNIEDSLNVLKKLHEKGMSDTHLVYLFPASYYSDFEYVRDLASLVHQYSLGPFVKFFTGFSQEEVALLYQAADVFLMTSKRFESFGFVTLEALKKGCPVFGYNSCATPEIITEDTSRFLVNPGNTSDLSRKISTYFKLPRREKALISRKIMLSARRFSITKMSTQLHSFIS